MHAVCWPESTGSVVDVARRRGNPGCTYDFGPDTHRGWREAHERGPRNQCVQEMDKTGDESTLVKETEQEQSHEHREREAGRWTQRAITGIGARRSHPWTEMQILWKA